MSKNTPLTVLQLSKQVDVYFENKNFYTPEERAIIRKGLKKLLEENLRTLTASNP